MQASAPITIDGETYDRYTINLAISSKYLPSGSADASVALRLTPTRITAEGQVEQRPDHARAAVLGDIRNPDAATAPAIESITVALQQWINAKGL